MQTTSNFGLRCSRERSRQVGLLTYTFAAFCLGLCQPDVLTAQTFSGTNRTTIVINDNSAATPYPSVISVAGLSQPVSHVTVTVWGLEHTFASDISMLLVGPQGQAVVLMSVVGDTNNTEISVSRLTFDDSAPTPLPYNCGGCPITNGTYQPTDGGIDDFYFPPAPSGPYKFALSAFNGTVANGNWSLYVEDTSQGDVGIITNGWSLNIATAPTAPNQAPTVSISNPNNGAVFVAPASFLLVATASDSDGTVTNVQFFQGTTSLGNFAANSSFVSVKNLLAGDYNFSAVATDNGGLTATNSITVHVQNPNQPPSVSISNPADGAVFTAPASFQLAAAASDSDGTVTNVEFFQGTTPLGNVAANPFAVAVNNLAAGDYSFSAVATDNGGLTATNHITVHVQNPTTQGPSVSITKPVAGAVFIAPASFQLTAAASDSTGTVTNVAFFQGSTPLGNVATSPFVIAVNNLPAGDYSFSAVATDNAGLTAANTITVHVTAPVSISTSGLSFSQPGHFQFTYSAILGRSYVVLRSTNLTTWIAIATNTATLGGNTGTISETFVDTAASANLGFYRLELLSNP